MSSQSPGTPTWESREFVPFGCAPMGRRRVYYREYGGGILPSPGRGESCGLKCPWIVPTPKGCPGM